MAKFIPKEKLSKKARRELNKMRRNTWGPINPVTRKAENKIVYNRRKVRIEKEDSCQTGSFPYFRAVCSDSILYASA